METHCGKIFITINHDPLTGLPVEVFCRFGKAGGCGSAIMDGLTRMISYGLRSEWNQRRSSGVVGISCHHGAKTCMNALAEAVQQAVVE
jgi:hypothetical protein